MPMAKRDLGKLGITSIDMLERPLPAGIRVAAKVILRKDDDGTEYNRVKSFDVIGIDADPTADPDFAPTPIKPELGEHADTKAALFPDKPISAMEGGQ